MSRKFGAFCGESPFESDAVRCARPFFQRQNLGVDRRELTLEKADGVLSFRCAVSDDRIKRIESSLFLRNV